MRLFLIFFTILLTAHFGCATSPKSRLEAPEPVFVQWEIVDAAGIGVRTGPLLEKAARDTLETRGFDLSDNSNAPWKVTTKARVTRMMRVDRAYRWVVTGTTTTLGPDGLEKTVKWSHAHHLDVEYAAEPRVLEALAFRIADEIDNSAGPLVDTYLNAGTPVETAVSKATPTAEKARPQAAKLQPTPDVPGDLIYFVMVDRFENGDPANDEDADPQDPQAFHGGDLRGLINRIEWIHQLGFKTIWLSPVFTMRDTPFYGHGAFHGYWLENPFEVEPRFGDEALLVELKNALEARGMRLILDVVVNHVAPESERVKTHPDWFHTNGPIQNWDDPKELETYQVHGLPDLNQANPEVYQWLFESTKKWVELLEPDGLRMDAVKHVPNTFWKRFNAEIQGVSKKPMIILGEQLSGDVTDVAKTATDGGFNAMFDFPLHFAMVDVFCKDASPGKLASVLAQDHLYGAQMGVHRQGLVTLLDNHDLSRIVTSCVGDRGRVLQAMRFMFSVRGTPSIIWGTEVGTDGSGEPENRSSMRFEEGHPMISSIQDLAKQRARHRVLETGVDHVLALSDEFFALLRVGDEEAALVVVNTSAALKTVLLPPELQPQRMSVEVPANTTDLVIIDVPTDALKKLKNRIQTPEAAKVRVEARGVELKAGQKLVFAGSLEELGSWDPMNAPEFEVKDGMLVLELALDAGEVAAGKLVVVDGQNSTWEERADRYFLARPGQILLRLDWQR